MDTDGWYHVLVSRKRRLKMKPKVLKTYVDEYLTVTMDKFPCCLLLSDKQNSEIKILFRAKRHETKQPLAQTTQSFILTLSWYSTVGKTKEAEVREFRGDSLSL